MLIWNDTKFMVSLELLADNTMIIYSTSGIYKWWKKLLGQPIIQKAPRAESSFSIQSITMQCTDKKERLTWKFPIPIEVKKDDNLSMIYDGNHVEVIVNDTIHRYEKEKKLDEK